MTAARARPQQWTDSQQEYERKKLANECLWCAQPNNGDSAYCNEHEPRVRKHKRASAAAIRKERRLEQLCADGCGRRSGEKYRCEQCQAVIYTRRNRVDNHTAGSPTYPTYPAGKNQIAPPRRPQGAWTVVTSTDKDGRTRSRNRFRGHGRRGGPKGFEVDDWDLRAIESEVSRARAALMEFWGDENQARPQIQQREPRRAALGHLELMQRFIDEIVERTRKAVK